MKYLKNIILALVVVIGLSSITHAQSGGLGGAVVDGVNGAIGGASSAVRYKVQGEISGWLNDALGIKSTPDGELSLPDPDEFGTIGENTSFREYIKKVVNFVLSFLGLVAVVFIIYAGWLYIVDGGADGQKDKAKKILIYVSIGIIVILASYALVNTIIQEAPVGGDDRPETAYLDQDSGEKVFFSKI